MNPAVLRAATGRERSESVGRNGVPCPRSPGGSRVGFTLTELMVVITIIMFLAMAVTATLYGAAEAAKRMRTEQTINKLSSQLVPRWESYMTRRLPLNPPVSGQALAGQKLRTTAMIPGSAMWNLWAKRELLRMDFPDRYTDLTFTPVFLCSPPSTIGANLMPYYSDMSRMYQRMVMQNTGNTLTKAITTIALQHSSAECLYMIITGNVQDNELAGTAFSPNEIGDNDNDYMPEFLDAWGNSIEFLRWAPGFNSDLQPVFSISSSDPAAGQYPKSLPKDPQNPNNFLSHFPVSYNPYVPPNTTGNNTSSMASQALQYAIVDYHDGFDPLELDPGYGNFPTPERGYNLMPLIVSAGPDGTAGQMNFNATSGSNTLSPLGLVDTSFGLSWGAMSPNPTTTSNFFNSDDDPYTSYSSMTGAGQTQRGAVDGVYGAASYDNIHNHLMRTRP